MIEFTRGFVCARSHFQHSKSVSSKSILSSRFPFNVPHSLKSTAGFFSSYRSGRKPASQSETSRSCYCDTKSKTVLSATKSLFVWKSVSESCPPKRKIGAIKYCPLIQIEFQSISPIAPILNISRAFSVGSKVNIGMELDKVVGVLKKMASPSLAGSWDNVGLLLEPSPPHNVKKVLLTNDLTPQVMQEAVDKGVDMIVSYHPPIFAPLKRVTQSSWKERIAGGCLEHRIALYSPHTSWDAAADGVNAWLIGAFDVSEVKPIEQTEQFEGGRSKKITFTTASSTETVLRQLSKKNPQTRVYTEQVAGAGEGDVRTKVHIQCPGYAVSAVLAAMEEHHIATDHMECSDMTKTPSLGYGMGRVGKLRSPISVEAAVTAVKSHLNLPHLRLAQAEGQSEIKSVAVCAGSGSSVLRGVKADLYLTGEMTHHEVLDAACKGTSVILCDHSNSERGFLKVVQGRLHEKLGKGVQVMVSETDRDPLVIV